LQFKALKRPVQLTQAVTDREFSTMWLGTAGAQQHPTDEWLMGLLHALCTECYLTCSQVVQLLDAFSYGDSKVEAVVKVREAAVWGRGAIPLGGKYRMCNKLTTWAIPVCKQGRRCCKKAQGGG
jgi:hypothetical protein